MKPRMFLKLVALGTLLTFLFGWLNGHDVLTGILLSSILLFVLAKFFFALIHGRGSGPGDAPLYPPYAPIPVPPPTPRPPELTGHNRR